MAKTTREERRDLRKRRQAAREEKIRLRLARRIAKRDPSLMPQEELESFHAGRPKEQPVWPMPSVSPSNSDNNK